MQQVLKYNLVILLMLIIRMTYAQLPDIVAMEYFFDNDPGFGNGTEVTITTDSLIDLNFNADLSGLSSGFHMLYVRVLDENGSWSLVNTASFLSPFIPPVAASPTILPQIVEMEYFFDTDPGFGNGTKLTIAHDSLIDVNFNIDLLGMTSGFHILFVRVKDESGNWNIAFTKGILKFPDPISVATPEALSQIIEMEYFFDTDPGFGSGTELTIAPDSLIDVNFEIDLFGMTSGFHILFVRVKDESGNWNIAFTTGILKFPDPIPVATPDALPQIVEMEYFFDADPGFGNGTDVPITTDSLVEIAFDADFGWLDNGTHNLYIRVKDENGSWTLLYSEPIFKFSPPVAGIPEILPDIVTMEYFIDNDPGFGHGTEILNTPDSLLIEDFIADISTLEPGKHMIFSRVKDENNKWSLSVVNEFCLRGLLVFLEGPYDSITGLMTTDLNDQGLIPLEQPFNSNPTANWYYDGAEMVTAIPNANIVDWLLLQARDAASPANATSVTVKENQVAFLLNNGNIVGLDGESLISFSSPIDNDLYLVVFHRNHLGVMSSFPLDTSGECEVSYNFSKDMVQAYGSENGHKEIDSGVWGMISGDGNGDGQLATDDKVNVWQPESGNTGYLHGDFDMTGQVDNEDKNEQWKSNNGSIGLVPD